MALFFPVGHKFGMVNQDKRYYLREWREYRQVSQDEAAHRMDEVLSRAEYSDISIGRSQSTVARIEAKGFGRRYGDELRRVFAEIYQTAPVGLEYDPSVFEHNKDKILKTTNGDHNIGNVAEINFSVPASGVGLPRKTAEIPLVGAVQAGAWVMAVSVEHVEEYVRYDRPVPAGIEPVALTVNGDSCNKKFPEGTRLIVIRTPDIIPMHLDFVIIAQPDGTGRAEYTVKQAVQGDNGVEFLPCSTNPKHQPVVIKPRDHDDQDGAYIYGVVWDHLPPREQRSGIPLRI